MFKKISAALLVASMLTAPALAATVIKTERAPAAKTATMKPSVANAKAQVVVVKKVRPHGHRKFVRHHRAHKHMAVVKKITVKRVSSATPATTVIVKKKI
ncbi:MAG: hypothetical protein NTZ72_16705 [Afipia sp.]|nr:hypothetical protein [Afipia sp.]